MGDREIINTANGVTPFQSIMNTYLATRGAIGRANLVCSQVRCWWGLKASWEPLSNVWYRLLGGLEAKGDQVVT